MPSNNLTINFKKNKFFNGEHPCGKFSCFLPSVCNNHEFISFLKSLFKTLPIDKNYQYRLNFSLFIYSNLRKHLVFHDTSINIDYSKLSREEFLRVAIPETSLLDEYFYKGYGKIKSINLENNPSYNKQMDVIRTVRNNLNGTAISMNKKLEINEFIDNRRYTMLEITRVPQRGTSLREVPIISA
jgi:hypothetical protein